MYLQLDGNAMNNNEILEEAIESEELNIISDED